MRPDQPIVPFDVLEIAGRLRFRRVGTRSALATSKVVMAGRRPRLALGSIVPTAVRLSSTQAAFVSRASIAEGQRVLLEEVVPIDDIRSRAEWGRRMATNLLGCFWSRR